MAYFDVFNGDADGLCALHQLRLAEPRDATLVTGVKRDIALLERTNAQTGDSITVLDVSMDVNRTALLSMLERGALIDYFDHHGSGEVPVHPGLHACIDTSPDICTGVIVNRWLGGAYCLWAVVAAFGDNLAHTAKNLTVSLALDSAQIAALQELGECLNYNAYGDSEDDLIMRPAMVYEKLHGYADPFAFIHSEQLFQTLREARLHDMNMAQQSQFCAWLPHGKMIILPDAAWSRRVRGEYSNFLAIHHPHQAHAVLTPNGQDGYTVSVRAPYATMRGADHLCQSFPHGGGRPAAAGINYLPQDKLSAFIHSFEKAWHT